MDDSVDAEKIESACRYAFTVTQMPEEDFQKVAPARTVADPTCQHPMMCCKEALGTAGLFSSGATGRSLAAASLSSATPCRSLRVATVEEFASG
jgi:hypothetical protein